MTPEIDGTPNSNRHHVHRGQNSPNTLLIRAEWKAHPTSRALSIAVRCLDCAGSPEAVRSCEVTLCGLFRVRSWQKDFEPRGQTHIGGHDETESDD
jgi:hypothetical protein